MSYELGTAKGRIDIDAKGAISGYAAASGAHDTFLGKLRGASPALRKTGIALLAVGAAAGAGLGLAVKASAEFEQSLSGFKAVSSATQKEMDKVRETALRIGRDTAFGAGQAIDAMVELSKAGINTADIIEGAADAVVALAAAGEVELSRAAMIMSAAMNIFGIEGKDAMRVSNALAGTANRTATDVESLGTALEQVGPSASLLGLGVEDTTTALGLLASAGITGGKAGTTLNRMLLQLTTQTPKAEAAMKELGLMTEDGANKFFDAEGNMRSLGEVSGLLADSMKGLTKEQQAAYLEAIFGSRALAAAAAMAKTGEKGFNDLKDAIGDVSAEEVATEKLDNLSGSMTILRGTIETALIGVGAPLQDVLKGIVDGVTNLINKFASLPPGFQKFIAIGLAVVAAVGLLGGAFLIFLSMLPAIAGGFAMLFTVVLPIVAPILAVVAAVAALAAGLVYAYKNSEAFRNVINGAFDKVKGFIQGVKDTWDKFVQGFRNGTGSIGQGVNNVLGPIQTFGGIVRQIADTVRDIFLAAVTKVGEVIDQVRGFIDKLVQGWTNGTGEIGQGVNKILGPIQQLGGIFRQVADAIRAGIGAAMEWLRETFEMFRPQVEAAMQSVGGMVSRFGELMSALQPVAHVVGIILAGAFKILVSAIQILWNIAQPIIVFLAKLIGDTLRLAISGVVQVFQGAIQIISGILDVFIGLFTGNWSKMWEGIKSIFTGIVNAIVGFVKLWLAVGILKIVGGAMKAITGVFKGAWNGIKSLFTGAGKAIANTVRSFVNAIRSRISQVMDAVKGKISSIWNGIKNYFSGIISTIRNIITTGFKAYRTVITNIVNGIKSRISSVFNSIKSFITNAVNGAKSAVTNAFNGMKTAASNAINGLLNIAKGLPRRFLRGLGNIGSFLKDAGMKLIKGLISGITGMAGKAVSAVKDTVLGPIKRLWPFSPAKEGPLSGRGDPTRVGRRIIEMLAEGIVREAGSVRDATRKITDSLSTSFASVNPAMASVNTPVPVGAAVGGGGDDITFMFDFRDGSFGQGAAEEIREALSSSDLLDRLTMAARAGRRRI